MQRLSILTRQPAVNIGSAPLDTLVKRVSRSCSRTREHYIDVIRRQTGRAHVETLFMENPDALEFLRQCTPSRNSQKLPVLGAQLRVRLQELLIDP